MKQLFQNAGVAQVQADVLSLTEQERKVEVEKIRTDFVGWMNSKFELTANQQQQLTSIPADFREGLASQIAEVFGAGNLISFQKDITGKGPDGEDAKGKDILLHNGTRSSYGIQSESLNTSPELSIWIGYT